MCVSMSPYVSILALCVHKIVMGDVKGLLTLTVRREGTRYEGVFYFGCCYTFGLLNHVNVLPIPKVSVLLTFKRCAVKKIKEKGTCAFCKFLIKF